MAVLPADLLDPKGPLQAALFPKDDSGALNTRLAGYIAEGITVSGSLTAPTLDRATRAYALYLSYSAVRTRVFANPARLSFEGEGEQQYSDYQMEEISRWADQYLAEFTALVAGAGSMEAPLLPPTGSTPNVYSF